MAASQRSRREGGIMRPPSPIIGLRRFQFQPNIVPGLRSGSFGRGDGGDRVIGRPVIYHIRPQAFPYSVRRTQGRGGVINGLGLRLPLETHPRWPPTGGSFWGSYGGGDGQLRAVFFSTAHSRRVLDFPNNFLEALDGELEERAQPEPPLMAPPQRHPILSNIFPVASDDEEEEEEEEEEEKAAEAEEAEQKSKEESKEEKSEEQSKEEKDDGEEEQSEEEEDDGVQEVS